MKSTQPASNTLQTLSFLRANGQDANLAEFDGKVILIVNVASKCGLTPQYEGLQQLYTKYRDQGLMIVGFPANEFLSQEPGSNDEIQQFCRLNYGVEFPVFAKIVVRGEGQHPLYDFLTSTIPTAEESGSFLSKVKNLVRPGKKDKADISWNFEKFLVSREGNAVRRFAPDVKPDHPALISAIEEELAR
jgi:glutathione peroxidase